MCLQYFHIHGYLFTNFLFYLLQNALRKKRLIRMSNTNKLTKEKAILATMHLFLQVLTIKIHLC